jgi:hypothetical protein
MATHVVVLRKVTTGTEAGRLLNEITRWADAASDITYDRRSDDTLELHITGKMGLFGAQRLVEDALGTANPAAEGVTGPLAARSVAASGHVPSDPLGEVGLAQARFLPGESFYHFRDLVLTTLRLCPDQVVQVEKQQHEEQAYALVAVGERVVLDDAGAEHGGLVGGRRVVLDAEVVGLGGGERGLGEVDVRGAQQRADVESEDFGCGCEVGVKVDVLHADNDTIVARYRATQLVDTVVY